MAYQRVEVLTGSERRRRYTAAEKAQLVDLVFRPGVVVTEAARRFGVHESLLYRWRRLMTAPEPTPAFVAVAVTPEPDSEMPAPADPRSTALPVPALPSGATTETRPTVEVALPGGARVRLDGSVDPALAAAVLAALASRRRPA